MDVNDYQQRVWRTHILEMPQYSPTELMLVWDAMGASGEAGELANLVKKAVFHQHGIDRARILDEIGDVLWYLAALCTNLGEDLETPMRLNIEKLKERYPEGWDPEKSINRKEGKG